MNGFVPLTKSKSFSLRKHWVLAISILVLLSCQQPPEPDVAPGQWEFASALGGLAIATNDSILATRFGWAVEQALAYAHSGDDPVGKWYEAALPDREAFCMRDVSHQSIGAYYLGLSDHTKNMLYKFAENISESKDWCSYWEINRFNLPAPVDYASDQEFWYNLPANFDVLIACWNQYLLTGDQDYLDDPVFVNFYQRTMNEYIRTWDLEVASIMKRNRFMNLDSPLDTTNSFQVCRGLPSYGEEAPLRLFMGGDLLCLQYQAYRVFESIKRKQGLNKEADSINQIAEKIHKFYNTVWWDSDGNRYYSSFLTNGKFVSNPSRYILQSGISQTPERQEGALQGLLGLKKVNIESQSYLPRLFYDYDENQRAFAELMDISRPNKQRREYPEVSYAFIEGMIEGMLGLQINASETEVRTMPHLTESKSWVRIDNIPLFGSTVMVTHKGNFETTLRNDSGSSINWIAAFPDTLNSLLVGELWMSAQSGLTATGKGISWVETTVEAGASMTIKAINN